MTMPLHVLAKRRENGKHPALVCAHHCCMAKLEDEWDDCGPRQREAVRHARTRRGITTVLSSVDKPDETRRRIS